MVRSKLFVPLRICLGLPCVGALSGCTPPSEEPPLPEPSGLVEFFRTPVGLNPEQGGIADLDRNGSLDIVVANHGSNSISILFNHGDAEFTALEQEGAFDGPCGIRIGDLDRDESPGYLEFADLDGDGDEDLLSINFVSSDLVIFRNERPD